MQAKEISLLKSMYDIVTASKSHSAWLRTTLFDGRTLRGLWSHGFIDYDMDKEFVTLTELGVGVALFGAESAEEAIDSLPYYDCWL
jgi:hypothetical protein